MFIQLQMYKYVYIDIYICQIYLAWIASISKVKKLFGISHLYFTFLRFYEFTFANLFSMWLMEISSITFPNHR